MLELDARVVRGEVPVGLGGAGCGVTPRRSLADEGFLVWDAPIEALASEDGEFDSAGAVPWAGRPIRSG